MPAAHCEVRSPRPVSEGVLFLSLDERSEQEVRLLTEALTSAYPACVPYAGEHPDPRRHLTIACGTTDELDAIEPQVTALRSLLPFTVRRTRLTVMEKQPSGRWVQGHQLPIGAVAR